MSAIFLFWTTVLVVRCSNLTKPRHAILYHLSHRYLYTFYIKDFNYSLIFFTNLWLSFVYWGAKMCFTRQNVSPSFSHETALVYGKPHYSFFVSFPQNKNEAQLVLMTKALYFLNSSGLKCGRIPLRLWCYWSGNLIAPEGFALGRLWCLIQECTCTRLDRLQRNKKNCWIQIDIPTFKLYKCWNGINMDAKMCIWF